MRRRALERHLREHGCRLDRHGARHDLWINDATRAETAVPRHTEINSFTVRHICRQLGVPRPAGR